MSGPNTIPLSTHLPVTTISAPRSRALLIGLALKRKQNNNYSNFLMYNLSQFPAINSIKIALKINEINFNYSVVA